MVLDPRRHAFLIRRLEQLLFYLELLKTGGAQRKHKYPCNKLS